MAWIVKERLLLLFVGLGALFSFEIPTSVSGLECGYPGSPVYGRPVPVRSSYAPGSSVGFTCSVGYTLLGNLKRVCLRDGTWSGKTPICDRSLLGMEQHASSRATLEMYDAQKAIDGHRDTCTYTDKKRPRWVRVDLRKPHLVQAVAVTVPKSAYQLDNAHFTIYVISVKDPTTASYHKCADFNGKFSTPTVKLPCGGGGIYGSYVHVEDNRKTIDYFSICEIEIFVKKDSYECGEPDRPSNSYTTNPEAGIVEYKCMHGFQLVGPKRRQCLPNGEWSSSQPLCKEIVCPLLSKVPHGILHYIGPPKAEPRQGTVANVTCEYGFYSGGQTLKCLESGQWSEGDLTCQPVDCKTPSTIGGQKFLLLNGTTTYGSMALFYCEGEETNETAPVVTCREDAKWSSHIDCSDPHHNSVISTLELVNGEENAVPNGVVIGMAIVVFLLLLVLVLILLLKRKQLLQRASSGSLPSKETTPSDESSTPYDNDAFYANVGLEEQKQLPPPSAKSRSVERGILATILFAKRKSQSPERTPSVSGGDSSSRSCFYEDIGVVSGSQRKQTTDCVSQPVYAQVDLEEKRRSRLAKTLAEHLDHSSGAERDLCCRPNESQVASYDSELDSEPIKLRELPPIPDDEQSSGTYASLSRSLDPPDTPDYPSGLYETRAPSTGHYSAVMKDNELYSTA